MFSLTRKTDYALVALTALAQQERRLSARGLADQLHLPLPLLRNIMKHLTQEGLISSTRGQRGGYKLARSAKTISLVDLIEAMEGPLHLTLCCCDANDPQRTACDLEDGCMVKRPVQRVHALMKQLLSRVSLAQIAADDLPTNIESVVEVTCPCRTEHQAERAGDMAAMRAETATTMSPDHS